MMMMLMVVVVVVAVVVVTTTTFTTMMMITNIMKKEKKKEFVSVFNSAQDLRQAMTHLQSNFTASLTYDITSHELHDVISAGMGESGEPAVTRLAASR